MTPTSDDDWSDSDEEVMSEVETSVLLGLPDGPIDSVADIGDAAVSRIGGHPAFLPSKEPPFSSSYCKICSNPMELLVQMWCPFENSPMDRALYIWGCAKSTCQGKEGSVRAWRGLRYNNTYAAKLEQKLARKREKEQAKAIAEAEKKKNASKSNPFAVNSSSAPDAFGLGAQIFGDVSSTEISSSPPDEELSDTETDASSHSNESLITALATTTIKESPWVSAPSYKALYLSTASEYLPPLPRPKLPPGAQIQDSSEDNGKKDTSWAFEAYENSLEVDVVFERFTKRVRYEGEQCVRYELDGTPLPFASDNIFQTLFPAPPVPPLPVTKPDFKVVYTPKRSYNPSSIPPCPICKSKRVFECQLMPNLINVLKSLTSEATRKSTDEERRKEVERILKGGAVSGQTSMDWGTCMIFSCANDCCLSDDGHLDARDSWREEIVYVQWDE